MPNSNSDNHNDDNQNDMNEEQLRKLCQSLARRKSLTPEQEHVLREARGAIAAFMKIEVDPHHQHVLHNRQWRFIGKSRNVGCNIKIKGRSTTGYLSQAVHAEMIGMTLEQVVEAKIKVNRVDELCNSDTDYRSEVMTLDAVNRANQRRKVELAEVPEQYWGVSWDALTEKWYYRESVNRQKFVWTSPQFESIQPVLDIRDFCKQHKAELQLIGNSTHEYLGSRGQQRIDTLQQDQINIFSIFSTYAKGIQTEIMYDQYKTKGFKVPSDNVIENLKINSNTAAAKQEQEVNRQFDKVIEDMSDFPDPVVNEELKASAPWNNVEPLWARDKANAYRKLNKHWDEFIRTADDPHRWPSASIDKLINETRRIQDLYAGH